MTEAEKVNEIVKKFVEELNDEVIVKKNQKPEGVDFSDVRRQFLAFEDGFSVEAEKKSDNENQWKITFIFPRNTEKVKWYISNDDDDWSHYWKWISIDPNGNPTDFKADFTKSFKGMLEEWQSINPTAFTQRRPASLSASYESVLPLP